MKTKTLSLKEQNLKLLALTFLIAFLTVRFEVWRQQQYIYTNGSYDYFAYAYLILPSAILRLWQKAGLRN